MLREIITPKTQHYTVQILLEYLNTQVEILVLSFANKETVVKDNSMNIIKKTAGLLGAQKIDPIAWQWFCYTNIAILIQDDRLFNCKTNKHFNCSLAYEKTAI